MFDQVVGQPLVYKTLSNAIKKNHLHHAILFHGNNGTGKLKTAIELAKLYLCEKNIKLENELKSSACNQCKNCKEINNCVSDSCVSLLNDNSVFNVQIFLNILSNNKTNNFYSCLEHLLFHLGNILQRHRYGVF